MTPNVQLLAAGFVFLSFTCVGVWLLHRAQEKAATAMFMWALFAGILVYRADDVSGVKLAEFVVRIDKKMAQAESTRAATEQLHKETTDLALKIVRMTYLQLAARNEFGTQRSTKAMTETIKSLNELIEEAIPDEKAREIWLAEMRATLPPPKAHELQHRATIR